MRNLFPMAQVPQLALVTQKFPVERVREPRVETRQRLLAAGLARKLGPGKRIAITAGSRGIGGFVDLVAGIVDAIKSVGARPFVIPAMGSHASASAMGQT